MEENLRQGSDGPSFTEEDVEPPSRKASFRVRVPRVNFYPFLICILSKCVS